MAKKRYLSILIPFIVIWLAALVFATVYDLDISLAIADRYSVFGRLFEIIGEPPAILFAAFNFAVLMAHSLRFGDLTAKNKLTAVLFAVLCVGCVIYTAVKTYSYVTSWYNDLCVGFRLDLVFLLLMILAAIIISAVFIMLALTANDEKLKTLYPIAKSCALAAVLTFVIIWALKFSFGRVRFRDLNGDLTLFTPWYLPNPFMEQIKRIFAGYSGNYSFPSGHTANATVVVAAIHYFPMFRKHTLLLKIIVIAVLSVWIPTVAVSRVMVGAHYLSDVLFGMAITLLIVYFTRPKMEL